MPSDREPRDAELVARTAVGDRGAFETLYARYAPRVMAFVDHLLSDRAAAEDATQETFVKIWRSARRFRADAPFEPWLFRIARHEAYDVARRRRRPRTSPAVTGADPRAGRPDAGGSGAGRGSGPSPLAEAIAPTPPSPPDADLAARLRAAVATLSEALRETFVLVRMLHRPHDEAALLLDVPIGTVKSRLAAAEAALRHRLRNPDGVAGGGPEGGPGGRRRGGDVS